MICHSHRAPSQIIISTECTLCSLCVLRAEVPVKRVISRIPVVSISWIRWNYIGGACSLLSTYLKKPAPNFQVSALFFLRCFWCCSKRDNNRNTPKKAIQISKFVHLFKMKKKNDYQYWSLMGASDKPNTVLPRFCCCCCCCCYYMLCSCSAVFARRNMKCDTETDANINKWSKHWERTNERDGKHQTANHNRVESVTIVVAVAFSQCR